MKWAVPELRRMNKPVVFDETLDLSNEIVGFNGVKKVSPIHVFGKGYEYEENHFLFSMKIEALLTLTCAITLEDIPYSISLDVEEIFGYDQEDDLDINLIDGQTIDLIPSILTNIIVNIPMRVVKDGAVHNDDIEEKDEINPAFASLAEYFKK